MVFQMREGKISDTLWKLLEAARADGWITQWEDADPKQATGKAKKQSYFHPDTLEVAMPVTLAVKNCGCSSRGAPVQFYAPTWQLTNVCDSSSGEADT